MSNELYSLTDAITALRAEISVAVEQAADEQLKFSLGDIELEFTIIAKRESVGDGRVKFSILGIGGEAGATAKIGYEQMQKVRIKLSTHSKTADGVPTEVLVGRTGNPKAFPFK